LLLRRKTSRKLSLCFRVRRNTMTLWSVMPHDAIEKMARIPSTIFEIGEEFAMISSNTAPDVEGNQGSVASIRALLGQRAPVWDCRR